MSMTYKREKYHLLICTEEQCLYPTVRYKVKYTLEQTTKAQRGIRSIALLFL